MRIQIAILSIAILGACGKNEKAQTTNEEPKTENVQLDPMKNKGIGPIKEVQLGPIDQELVRRGEEIFKMKCSACHEFDKDKVGPALKGITKRRTPEWIMNMILNPDEMLEKDPIAQELLSKYFTRMPFQNVSEEDARAILEYFRYMDEKEGSDES